MFKYIRKNQKKVLAIFSIALMLAFALPSATSQFTQREPAHGTIAVGGKTTTLTQRDYQSAANEWRVLRQAVQPRGLAIALGDVLNAGDPMGQQQQFMFGSRFAQQLEDHEDAFLLLLKEARAMGITASDDAVGRFLTEIVNVSKDENPKMWAELFQPVKDLLTVRLAADRAASLYKVSVPAREHALVTQGQRLSVQLVEFDYRDCLARVLPPTAKQLTEQFEKYKNVVPPADGGAPGYKYPNRVKYDAVAIKREEVAKAVPEVDLVEVNEYYLRHKNDEELQITVPSGAGAKPEDQFTLGGSKRPKTFEEAEKQIRDKLTNQRVDELTNKVRDLVRNTMKADYEAYKAAVGAKQAAPKSSVGAAYDTFDYLKALRDKVQKELNVTVTIEETGHPMSSAALAATDLGGTSYAPPNRDESYPLADYLTGQAQQVLARGKATAVGPEAFLDEEQRKALSARQDLRLQLWEPSPVFANPGSSRLVIARVSKAEPAHVPASLDEVREQLVADVKKALAYDLAKQDAEAALKKAQAAEAPKFLYAVAAELKKPLITTGLIMPPQRGFAVVPGYELKGKALDEFMKGAYGLLSVPPRTGTAPRPAATQPATAPATTKAATQAAATTKPATQTAAKPPATAPAAATQPAKLVATPLREHPIGVIELPSAGKVLLAEVDQLKPGWTKDTAWQNELAAYQQERMMLEFRFLDQWFNYENIKARTGFKPQGTKEGGPERERPQQAPPNPFQ